jgi:hypothetical protein
MARSLDSAVLSALAARTLVARDFLWFVVRDRDTGDPVTDGMWSDIGNVTAEVIDPDTGTPVERSFYGSGTLVGISDIPLVSNVTVQQVTITLSQVDDRVADLVRTYDVKQARVEIFRGLFDPATRLLVAPAVPRFVGFVDEVQIQTPAEGGDGAVVLTCASHTQEMLRSNPDTRSHESQKQRLATDNFFQDASVVGEWELFWGKKSGKASGK